MLTARDQLRHLAECVSEEEAERLLSTSTARHLLCPDAAGCPGCGERLLDRLSWTDDECLCCATCATTYDPNGPGHLGGSRAA